MGFALQQFGRVITAMVTAFDNDGVLDVDETVRVARFLEASGNTALVVSGTTGEASTLTDPEKLELWSTISDAVTIPVLAGSGTNDTPHSIKMTKSASKLGISGILAVGPYYNRPAQSGILGHLDAMAKATDLPVIVYDIPIRTGRKIANETVLRLVDANANVVGLKDASGDPATTAMLIAKMSSTFDVYSGDDSLTLPLMAIGAVGVIGVATHWATPLFKDMIEAFLQGDHIRAVKLNSLLIPSYNFETSETAPNPVPTKVLMEAMGFNVGECRLPLGPPPEDLAKQALLVLDEIKSVLDDYSIEATS